LLILSIQISTILGSIDLFGGKCSAICGITEDIPEPKDQRIRLVKRSAEEEDDGGDGSSGDYISSDEYASSNETEIGDEDTRIVNGYNAKSRPWLVLINVKAGWSSQICGGVLINNKFVMSAAHCFCKPTSTTCKVMRNQYGVPVSVPNYDVKKKVTFYVGINGKAQSWAKSDPNLRFKPDKVWIRDRWVLGQGYTPDLALARLSRRVNFKTNVIAPICMPSKLDTKLSMAEKNKVFIAGWGAQTAQGMCDTNDSGPSPNMMCKFPFVHNGRQYNFCTHDPTPAEIDPVCKAFFEWSKCGHHKIRTKDSNGAAIPVEIEYRPGRYKFCFDTRSIQGNRMGWCGTCYKGVNNRNDVGKEGYCDPFNDIRSQKRSLRSEYAKPSTGENWGMCADWCRPYAKQKAAENLKETALDLLDPHICNVLGKSIKYDEKQEICAGHKKYFPPIDAFVMKRGCRNPCSRNSGYGSHKNCFYKSHKHRKNVYDYGIKTPFDFYLGGTDSCQGDSGGPLISFLRQGHTLRGHVIGVVSRGEGCANLNAPGIFSKVSHHLDWIKSIASEGTC